MARQDFPKSERVKARAEIGKIFDRGVKYSCKGMRLHALASGRTTSRLAIAPVRSFSGAVTRNRAKRLVRECWRRLKAEFGETGYDCVVVVFPGFDSYESRHGQLSRLLRQAGVLADRR